MKLSQWAKNKGISYGTALRWIKEDKFPDPYIKTETGTIIVEEIKPELQKYDKKYVLYGRVSSSNRKEDLIRQMERLRMFSSSCGIIIYDEISEIASGMNDKRPKLLKLLQDKNINIIVEHKDRLTRFGFNYIKTMMESENREIIVMNDTEEKMDIVQDFIDIITSMCSRIYGTRSGANKKNKFIECIKEKIEEE